MFSDPAVLSAGCKGMDAKSMARERKEKRGTRFSELFPRANCQTSGIPRRSLMSNKEQQQQEGQKFHMLSLRHKIQLVLLRPKSSFASLSLPLLKLTWSVRRGGHGNVGIGYMS